MKLSSIVLLVFVLLAAPVFAQKPKKGNFFVPGQLKPELFGIAFNLSDFNAPKNFGSKPNSSSLSIKDMSAGVSVFYWRPLTPMIDFSAKLNGIFHDYSAIYYGTPGKTEIGLELEPTVNIRAIKDENLWSPFLTTGAGIGLYTNHIGAYLPLGVGLQFNASNTTYFFIQAQYKISITPKVLGDNLFYSLGFAQNIKGD